MLCHVALAVSDENRSRSFYERYLGFDARRPRRYPDGVLMLFDGRGSALALGPADASARLPDFLHFGYVLDDPEAARQIVELFERDNVPLLEREDGADYVGCKVADPDGYVVEVFWEAGWELLPAGPPRELPHQT
jgi:catechol 2,3-dioxygenase-like lactoylglutathione lyase family enzyme